MKIKRIQMHHRKLNIKMSRRRTLIRIAYRGYALYISCAVLELACITIVSILLFLAASFMGRAQRGYAADGGELVFILLPLIYYLGRRIVSDMVRDIADVAGMGKEK